MDGSVVRMPQPAAQKALWEEFLVREHEAARLQLQLAPNEGAQVLVHGHCHQKAFDAFTPVQTVLLLPAVRKRAPGAIVVADGTSCRHQIHDGADTEAVHVARVLAAALNKA